MKVYGDWSPEGIIGCLLTINVVYPSISIVEVPLWLREEQLRPCRDLRRFIVRATPTRRLRRPPRTADVPRPVKVKYNFTTHVVWPARDLLALCPPL